MQILEVKTSVGLKFYKYPSHQPKVMADCQHTHSLGLSCDTVIYPRRMPSTSIGSSSITPRYQVIHPATIFLNTKHGGDKLSIFAQYTLISQPIPQAQCKRMSPTCNSSISQKYNSVRIHLIADTYTYITMLDGKLRSDSSASVTSV